MMHLTTTRDLRKVRLLWATGACALLMVGGVLVSQQLRLSTLAEAVQSDALALQIQAFDERVAALEQRVDRVQQRPAGVSTSDFEATRTSLAKRLDALDAGLTETVLQQDLQPIRSQLENLEAALQRAGEAAKNVPMARAAPRPLAVPEPPFQILGLEARGGERFLSIAPLGTDSLTQTQLLRVGDTYGGWQLSAIEQQAAVFRVNAQARRLPLP